VGTITALRLNSRKKQVNVFIDGLFSFTIADELAVANHLAVGRELSADQIEELTDSNLFHNCMNAAVQFLSYRPRSESEVRQRLRQRGFDRETIEGVILKLKERRLLDDAAFAEFWVSNRLSFSPRSARLINLELRRKGVAAQTVSAIVQNLDDEHSAYDAGLKKAHRLSRLGYDDFRRRLYDYLRRCGFNYDTCKLTTERLWQEKEKGNF
jgi:regulatory protein